MCVIVPQARGRFVKVGGGEEIPFDCKSHRAQQASEPAKQEAASKEYQAYTQDDQHPGVWKKSSSWGTPEQASGFMERGCMAHRKGTIAVKTVAPTGKETVRNCAEWRAANPGK